MGGGLKRRIFTHISFDEIVSLENLLLAWREFKKGKRGKLDVQTFEYNLEDNIFSLHQDLKNGTYRHSKYYPFRISDPKPRLISKAIVKDRVLHRAIYRALYPLWDNTFIYDSYSCRDSKGTHKAFTRLTTLTRKISQNYTKPCFALKLDIRKFFDSIDHQILMSFLEERIQDKKLVNLVFEIISSFELTENKGIPLGNLTSQLFANVYMDALDKFVKHKLKAKHYIRYADDFILFANNPDTLMGRFVEINRFLKDRLKLNIHPNKAVLRKLNWGIDYVGYVSLPYYSIPRKKTVKRIYKKVDKLLREGEFDELAKVIPSYLGYLQHSNSHKLQSKLKDKYGDK